MTADAAIETIEDVAEHSGVVRPIEAGRLARAGELRLNDRAARLGDVLRPGDVLTIRGVAYRVRAGGGRRMQLLGATDPPPGKIRGRIRVHAGYHKCLTMFSRKVHGRTCRAYRRTYGILGKRPTSFRHFFHRLDAFYAGCTHHAISSVSGHCIDLDRFEDVRVVRFVRDPRDLLVSSYYYHKRGAEQWCSYADPVDLDWQIVNGVVPGGLAAGQSLVDYLESSTVEEGLVAEMEFRRRHLESMMAWPLDDERVRVFRYEDIISNEARTFSEVARFFGLGGIARWAAMGAANRYRAGKKEVQQQHIRNPRSQQWRELFTPKLRARFNARYGDLLARYDYPRE